MMTTRSAQSIQALLFVAGALLAAHAFAQPVQPVLTLAQKERPALLETLKELTAIVRTASALRTTGKASRWCCTRSRSCER